MCVFLFKFHIWLIYLFGICAKFQNIWFVLKMYCHLSEYDMQTSQILDFTLLYKVKQLFFIRTSNLPWLFAALLTFHLEVKLFDP